MFLLLDMLVIADMLGAVAVVPVTAGAIAKFQTGIGNVRSAADGAFVGVIDRFGGGGGEGDGFCGARRFFPAAERAAEPQTAGFGDHIAHILAEKQEIVRKRDQWEEIIGEVVEKQAVEHHADIQYREDPRRNGNDKENKKARLRIQGGVTQKQCQIDIEHIRLTVKNHGVDIHEQDAAQKIDIEFQGAPDHFQRTTQRIEAVHGNDREENAACGEGQRIGDEPPNLTVEDGIPVKAQRIVQCVGVGGHVDHIYKDRTQNQIQHQVGNALGSVPIAEAFKSCAQVFQDAQLP